MCTATKHLCPHADLWSRNHSFVWNQTDSLCGETKLKRIITDWELRSHELSANNGFRCLCMGYLGCVCRVRAVRIGNHEWSSQHLSSLVQSRTWEDSVVAPTQSLVVDGGSDTGRAYTSPFFFFFLITSPSPRCDNNRIWRGDAEVKNRCWTWIQFPALTR